MAIALICESLAWFAFPRSSVEFSQLTDPLALNGGMPTRMMHKEPQGPRVSPDLASVES